MSYMIEAKILIHLSVYCRYLLIFCSYFVEAWGSVVVKALRYQSDSPGIDSRWCHWGFFPWYPRQNHVPWGWLSLWKWVPGISPGVKAAGAFGWWPTTLVVPKHQEIWGLNLPGTPWATSACRKRPLLCFTYYHDIKNVYHLKKTCHSTQILIKLEFSWLIF